MDDRFPGSQLAGVGGKQVAVPGFPARNLRGSASKERDTYGGAILAGSGKRKLI